MLKLHTTRLKLPKCTTCKSIRYQPGIAAQSRSASTNRCALILSTQTNRSRNWSLSRCPRFLKSNLRLSQWMKQRILTSTQLSYSTYPKPSKEKTIPCLRKMNQLCLVRAIISTVWAPSKSKFVESRASSAQCSRAAASHNCSVKMSVSTSLTSPSHPFKRSILELTQKRTYQSMCLRLQSFLTVPTDRGSSPNARFRSQSWHTT